MAIQSRNLLLLVLNFLFITTITAQIPNFEWAQSLGANFNDEGKMVRIDKQGNVYTLGTFLGMVDFDPGVGVVNISAQGSSDIFIQKLDANGNFVWAKSIGGSSSDVPKSFTIDASGNLCIIGYFIGTIDLDPGMGIYNQTAITGRALFTLKLDSNGSFIWGNSIGNATSSPINSSAIVTDTTSNIYITGYFGGTIDFDPGAGITNLTSLGSDDIFVQKLDSNGNFIWAKSVGGIQEDRANDIAIDANEDIYLTGYFLDTVDFDPGAGIMEIAGFGSPSAYEIFILKLDSNGDFVWVKSIEGQGDEEGRAINVDANGDLLLTGYFLGLVDFDPNAGVTNLNALGNGSSFILKLDLNGSFIWVKAIENFGNSMNNGESIATDLDANIYLLGDFLGSIDSDPSAGTFSLTAMGGRDVYVLKLDVSGNFVWGYSVGGVGHDRAAAICSNTFGNVLYITGNYTDIVDFDPSTAVFNLTSNGFKDAFVQKMESCLLTTGLDVQSACNSYTWLDGNTYTTSNTTATHTLTNSVGCDSVVTLNLTILNSSTGVDVQSVCNSYTWLDGNTYTASTNSATHTLTNSVGCDSVVTLNLTILNSSTGVDVQSACNSYTWLDGNTYTTSNNSATHTLTNSVGCDSVVTLNLTILNSSTGVDVQSACNSYTWLDGNTYTASTNSAMHTLTNSVGCDSVVTLNLTILNSSTGVDVQSACNSYTWLDGNTYTTSTNSATHTLTNSVGCDSVVTLNLTILNSSTGVDVQSACNSYTWLDGNTYTTSTNSATHTLTNAVGCDSVVTLNLTILNSSTGVDVQSACNSYTWLDGNTYTTSTNSATHTLTNSVGCDSVVTLNLTILNSSTGVDVQSACNSYTWLDGNTYTTSTNSATHTLTNAVGCDSVVTLNLTILNSSTGVDVQSACNSYTWLDGNTYTTSTNSAMHTLTNSVGCDSVVTLNLTILNSSTGVDVQSACNSYTWLDGNTYTTSTNSATHTLTNSVGCDSVVTLNLTINQVNTNVTTTNATISADATGASYQWLDCNDNYNLLIGNTGQTFTAIANGDYAVQVTENGCVDTSACVNISVLRTKNVNVFLEEITIYPNPTDGNVTIDLGNLRDVSIEILGSNGQLIHFVNILGGIYQFDLDVAAGLFFVRITTQKGTQEYKLIKR